ncbi:transglycosylase SLT domain-containing protein [Streptomyces bugieae]|uniref:Transglycosylase SLT domain-containing protein n=1 Tax=Streptomyces bugieae TaxID=3098223 RepID=A0ABU7NKW3_9ACTN|nr:transglycosylase SLT domain-containing protein [Streptomyces sp. DSM 41528]
MAGPTIVGSTRVSILPDTSGFSTQLRSDLTGIDQSLAIDIKPKIHQPSYEAVERKLDKLIRDRVVEIRANVDTRVAANEIQNLIRRRVVRVGADVDTRVAANDLANLTRRRTVRITANADTRAASTVLDRAARNRTARIDANVDSSPARQLSNVLSLAGGAMGALASKGMLLTAAIPIAGSLANAVAAIAPAAALAIPAIAAIGSAFGAIKLGTSGLGDAFKQAFAPQDSAKAVKSANTVASAERAVKQAVEQVGVARENAAAANQAAARSVLSAERDLTDAQANARQAQQDLNAAREEAVQNLRDLNQQLAHGALDQRSASLAVKQAQEDLYKTLSDPRASELQRQQAQLTYDEAVQNLKDQTQKQKDLKVEVAAANKAGVEGSKVVLQAKQAEARAQRDVKDREQAVADARTAQARTARDGARSIAQAQQAVADAQQRVADAQTSAAAGTSKLNDALAKLSPNARSFVSAVQALKPAWDAMRLSVQDKLFAGLGSRLQDVGGRVIPILRDGLGRTATVLNQMGQSALSAVDKLAKTGKLKQILDGAAKSLSPLKRVPGQLVTAFGQVSIAAQPALQKLSEKTAGVVDRIAGKLTAAFESGTMEKTINNAVDLFGQLMQVGGNVLKIINGVFQAGAKDGGGMIGFLKTITGEMAKIVNSKEVQGGLKALFGVMGQFAKTAGPILGQVMKILGRVFEKLGPPVEKLISALGSALQPVIKALEPVFVQLASTIGDLVPVITPLLDLISDLLVAALKPMTPVIKEIGKLFIQLAPIFKQLADGLGKALTPILSGLGAVLQELVKQGAAEFLELLKAFKPIMPDLISAMVQLGKSFGKILTDLAPLIPQILTLSDQFLIELLPAILPLVPPILRLTEKLTKLGTEVIERIVIPALTKFINFIKDIKRKMQPFIDAVKWVTDKIAAGFEWLSDHLVGHSVIPDMLKAIRDWFNRAKAWIRGIWNACWENTIGRVEDAADAIGTKIGDFAHGVRDWFGRVRTWVADRWNGLWSGLSSRVSSIRKTIEGKISDFRDNVVSFFRSAVNGIGSAWSKLQNLAKAPVKFLVNTVFNKGIVRVWNATAAKLPGIGEMSPMTLPKGFARGGVIPGQSSWRGGDTHLRPMREGEGVYVSEAMRDPYERARLYAVNAAAMAGRSLKQFRGYATGGIIGDIWDTLTDNPVSRAVGSILNKGVDWARGGLADLAKTAFVKLLGPLDADASPTWTGLVQAVPRRLASKAVSWIHGKEGEGSALLANYKPGSGVAQWTNVVLDALKAVSQPASLLNTVLRRMNQESGGNPRAINNWDINAKNGTPSKGLMQVIDPTFDAYAGALRGRGIWDPLANIYASMRYAMSRYGSLARAYNQPGGYARGGSAKPGELAWVGEEGPELMKVFAGGVRIYSHSDSVRMARQMGTQIPGYASGGVISSTGRGSIASVIGKAFLDGLEGTATQIKDAIAKVTTAIKNAFKGLRSTIDDRLLKSLSTTSTKLQALSTQQAKIAATIATAKQLATDQTAAGKSFASVTALPNSGLTFDAGGILSGLNVRLGQLKAFSSNLGKLAKMGLSKELLQQLVQAGPDSGAAYAQALVNATPGQLKSINATQAQIDSAASSYGNSAADALYDAGSQAGKGFLAGLTAQQKSIEYSMSALAKAIQKSIKSALKIKSPSRVMAELGEYTVQGFAHGMAAATPQAAETAARMAAAVRSTTVATTTSMETTTTSTVGERHLHYNATTREVASRQSILAALALDDQLHRPVLIGG